MEIRYSKAAGKAIGEMDRPAKQRIKTAIEKLPDGDVKPLRGAKGLIASGSEIVASSSHIQQMIRS